MIETADTTPWLRADDSKGTTASTHYNFDVAEEVDDANVKISPEGLLRVLEGVAVATKTSESDMEPLTRWIASCKSIPSGNVPDLEIEGQDRKCDKEAAALSLHSWHAAIASALADEDSRQLASLALGVAFLRETCLQEQGPVAAISSRNFDYVWSLIQGALCNP